MDQVFYAYSRVVTNGRKMALHNPCHYCNSCITIEAVVYNNLSPAILIVQSILVVAVVAHAL